MLGQALRGLKDEHCGSVSHIFLRVSNIEGISPQCYLTVAMHRVSLLPLKGAVSRCSV